MICVSLAGMSYARLRRTVRRLTMAEIRLDQLALSREEITAIFSQPLPLIATCRPGRHSGLQRLEWLTTAIAGGAAFIDVEMDADGAYRHALLKTAAAHHCRVIISYHNESETPPANQLQRIVGRCFSQGAAIAKVACRVKGREDVLRLLALYGWAPGGEGSLIALGMGAQGKLTRIIAPFLGAPFTYAALSPGKETAAGQMSVARMATMISELKGT